MAEQLEPLPERALQQTFAESVTGRGSSVLAWNTQVGNQEDFEGQRRVKGAAPGAIGALMLMIMAALKGLLGKRRRRKSIGQLPAWRWIPCGKYYGKGYWPVCLVPG